MSTTIASIIRVVLGVLFFSVGVSKIIDLDSFVAVLTKVAQLFLTSASGEVALVVGASIATWEMVLGAFLVTGWRPRWIAAAAITTLCVFSAYLVLLTVSPDLPKDCGCGNLAILLQGSIDGAVGGIMRNIVLVLGAGFVMWQAGRASQHGGMRSPKDQDRAGANELNG